MWQTTLPKRVLSRSNEFITARKLELCAVLREDMTEAAITYWDHLPAAGLCANFDDGGRASTRRVR
jgi:hypothetical protein